VTPMSIEELWALPAVVDVPTAGRAYGIGERLSYELALRGEFPVEVLTLGRFKRVRRADLLAHLAPDMEADPAPTGSRPTTHEVLEAPHDVNGTHSTLRAV
jgi:hypothetical protein